MEEKKIVSFLLLLDTSGSMYGEKIYALNLAVSNLLSGFKRSAPSEEPLIAIITYGGEAKLHTPFTYASEICMNPLEARGDSPLTEALELAKTIITQMTTIVLISDGMPNDGSFARKWEELVLVAEVYCIAIGFDADLDMLERFTKEKRHVLMASDTENLSDYLSSALLEVVNNGTDH